MAAANTYSTSASSKSSRSSKSSPTFTFHRDIREEHDDDLQEYHFPTASPTSSYLNLASSFPYKQVSKPISSFSSCCNSNFSSMSTCESLPSLRLNLPFFDNSNNHISNNNTESDTDSASESDNSLSNYNYRYSTSSPSLAVQLQLSSSGSVSAEAEQVQQKVARRSGSFRKMKPRRATPVPTSKSRSPGPEADLFGTPESHSRALCKGLVGSCDSFAGLETPPKFANKFSECGESGKLHFLCPISELEEDEFETPDVDTCFERLRSKQARSQMKSANDAHLKALKLNLSMWECEPFPCEFSFPARASLCPTLETITEEVA